MTSPVRRISKFAISPFDQLNFLSIGATAAIAAAISVYCHLLPSKEFVAATRHMLHYLGFIHFAVGYHFFFASPMVRPQLKSLDPRFFIRLMGCVALSVLVYQNYWTSEPVVYALFYLHAVENAVFHIFKLAPAHAARPTERVTTNMLFPMLVVLVLLRLSPGYVTELSSIPHVARVGVVLGCLVFLRRLLPATDWRGGWALLNRYPFVIGAFLIVSFMFPEHSALYDFFIIWHYVIWFVYTWIQRPTARKRLLWSHAVFAVIYKGLYLLADAQIVLGHPVVLDVLVAPMCFTAHTACHILLSFVFRKFPDGAGEGIRPQPVQVVPAG